MVLCSLEGFDPQTLRKMGPRSWRKDLFYAGSLTVLIVLGCVSAFPQNRTPTRPSASDLGQENMNRVAASAAQIEALLRGNPGLMVELKGWVAKDATDHGQLISDADLTDQAIFDRLEMDVQFRSVATRLMQKYGYLLPKINPDSPQGKEQELLVQERTKWLAQDQEEAIHQAHLQSSSASRERACNPSVDSDCVSTQRTQPAGQAEPQSGSSGQSPRILASSPPNNSSASGFTSHTEPTLEQAELMQTSAGMPLGASRLSSPPATTQTNGQPRLDSSGPVEQDTAGGEMFPPIMDSSLEIDRQGTDLVRSSPLELKAVDRAPSAIAGNQRMIRQPNPYDDIPSLYDMYLQASPQPPVPERFGMEVFQNGTRDLQMIPMDLPVGPDYVVGPGDGLAIDLWGGVSQRIVRTVDREGRLSLPEVGPVLVSGKSMADVQQTVQRTLRSQFRDVSADVSLARLRNIRVYVVGDVAHPGAYDISSLSTPLNAIFAAGGPTENGSLRDLEHYRGKQLVQEVDVYDLLLHGVKTDIERLENGDTVLVPPIGGQVTVEGMVRRPSIYELKGEKSLTDVLALAGGLLPTATLRHIEVQRTVSHDKRTMLSVDIPESVSQSGDSAIIKQLDSFRVQDGDKIRIFPIAPYSQNAIYLEGHALRPGRYSYHAGMRVTDLISSYKDLLPEPATQYAEIIRLSSPDYRPVVESFNLAEALSHPASAPILEPLDTVQIFSRYDFENPPTVSVWGDVRNPGTYRSSGEIHLSDAIHMAGGLGPDAEREDAQVFRYLPDGELKIFSVKLNAALDGNPLDNIVLNSRDRILVHSNPAEADPATVYIRGEVARPGRYPLTTNMRAADLVRTAGGFKRSADTASADLTRYIVHNQKQLVGQHEELSLSAALSGNANQDIPLVDGDVLTIRQIPGWSDIGASVVLKGEVKHPGTYGIRPGERLSSVLQRAGGFLPSSYPRGTVMLRVEVRKLQELSRQKLIEEIRQDSASTKDDIDASAQERAELQKASIQQHQEEIQALEQAPVTGRVVTRIPADLKHFSKSEQDVELRDGDSIFIPKRPDFVLVTGQVYNSNAITYFPGRNARWYLSQAGGATNLAEKGAIFIIRADGGVITGRGQGWWKGDVLSRAIEPGDTIVVPEKPVGGSTTWKNLLSVAQIAQAAALSAFVFTR